MALTGVALVASRFVEQLTSSAVRPAGVLLGSVGVVAARWSLSPGQLGVAWSTWRRGCRDGAVASAAVGGAYLVAYAVPRARQAAAAEAAEGSVLAEAGLRIPLITVVPEELAFRGVLFALLSRVGGPGSAVTYSALAFGLWHVPPAFGAGLANAAAASALGSTRVAVALRVTATVVLTAGAGLVFAVLRRRSDSLLAPLLAHWAVNGFGALFAALARRRCR